VVIRTSILVLLACGLLAPSATAARIAIPLHMAHHSGQTGTATLVTTKSGFTVTIVLHGKDRFVGTDQPAHIHKVTCAQYAKITDVGKQYATVSYTLYSVISGKSVTPALTKLQPFLNGKYSINVHEENPPYTNTVCGDIPKR